jgi:transposase
VPHWWLRHPVCLLSLTFVHDRPAREIGLETGTVRKAPLNCTGTRFYQMCAWRLHRYTYLPTSPRPIRNRPQKPVFASTNQKSPSKVGLCLDQSEIALKSRSLPRPIRNRPQKPVVHMTYSEPWTEAVLWRAGCRLRRLPRSRRPWQTAGLYPKP